MLLLQKPKDVNLYTKVDSEKSKELQKKGYFPSYFYEGFYYYKK